jgi:hypothetical protein
MDDENTISRLEPRPNLTPDQWAALPRHERIRLRQLKLAHRRAEAIAASQDGETPVEEPSASRPPPADTPFRDSHNRPLYLENLYFGASCFLMLSGPSALSNDLTELRRRGIYTIAVNNAATIIRPNSWIFVDPPEKFHSAIWLDPAVTKFVHNRFLEYRLREKIGDEFRKLDRPDGKPAHVRDMPGVVSIIRNADFRPNRWLRESSINWGNSKRSARRNNQPRDLNVMLAALKLAYVLGFRAVYLLGCDFLMTDDQPYSFTENKHASAVGSNNNKYRRITEMLQILKPYFEGAGFHVRNCNPRSGLTLFPFVSYTEAIQAASGHVPQDPLDTMNWYRKGN